MEKSTTQKQTAAAAALNSARVASFSVFSASSLLVSRKVLLTAQVCPEVWHFPCLLMTYRGQRTEPLVYSS